MLTQTKHIFTFQTSVNFIFNFQVYSLLFPLFLIFPSIFTASSFLNNHQSTILPTTTITMEPMALGSPSSPGSSASPFLPSYLMGDPPMTPPRNTNLSPTKTGRALAFGLSPTSPRDAANRSNAFRNPLSPTTTTGSMFPGAQHQHHAGQSLNASVSGPPTQGLFDSLSTERNYIQGSVTSPQINSSGVVGGGNYSHLRQQQITSPYAQSPTATTQLNESTSIYNATPQRSSRQSIIPGPKHNFHASSPFPAANATPSMTNGSGSQQGVADCWITVFGFPQSATSMILSHFAQCGTIVNKMHPTNTGNWMHLRFTSRLECDRAMNYNEKVLNNFFMIGVTRCKDPIVLELDQQREDMENSSFVGNTTPVVGGRGVNGGGAGNVSSIRPLAHIAYKTVQSPTDVAPSPTAPTKSTGILDRAMDFFLGW